MQVGFIEEQVSHQSTLDFTDNFEQHILCTGATGCGKTSSFILPMIEQTIQNDESEIVFDFKGDMLHHITALAHKYQRLLDVVAIDEIGDSLNIISDCEDYVKDAFKTISGEHKDDFWSESASNLMMTILRIYQLLNIHNPREHTITLRKIYDTVNVSSHLNGLLREMKKFVKELNRKSIRSIKDVANKSLIEQMFEHLKTIETYVESAEDSSTGRSSGFNGVRMSLLSALESIKQFDELNYDRGRSIGDYIAKNRIVYINMSRYPDSIGSFILQLLYKQLQYRRQKHPVTLFLDEMHRLIPDNESMPFVDTFRSKRVRVVGAVQNSEQLQSRLGDKFDEFISQFLLRIDFIKPFHYQVAERNVTYQSKRMELDERRGKIALAFLLRSKGVSLSNGYEEELLLPLHRKDALSFICYDYIRQKNVLGYYLPMQSQLISEFKMLKEYRELNEKMVDVITFINNSFEAYGRRYLYDTEQKDKCELIKFHNPIDDVSSLPF